MAEIWNWTQPAPMPEKQAVISTWHGSFGVSRARILLRSKDVYQKILDRLESPVGDPIYDEDGHWDWKGVPDG